MTWCNHCYCFMHVILLDSNLFPPNKQIIEKIQYIISSDQCYLCQCHVAYYNENKSCLLWITNYYILCILKNYSYSSFIIPDNIYPDWWIIYRNLAPLHTYAENKFFSSDAIDNHYNTAINAYTMTSSL